MGLLNALTGTKKPQAGTPVLSEEELRFRLLGLNRPSAPFQIIDGPGIYHFLVGWRPENNPGCQFV